MKSVPRPAHQTGGPQESIEKIKKNSEEKEGKKGKEEVSQVDIEKKRK